MGQIPQVKIDQWVKAAGKTANVGREVLDRIITAGTFIEHTARIHDASSLLRGIDFSKPVKVVRALPDKVYVQFLAQHQGRFFTDTGLTPTEVGLAKGKRKRKLFRPRGSVAALQSTAQSIKDVWTKGRLFESRDPQSKEFGEPTRGGGTQFLVANVFQMEEV